MKAKAVTKKATKIILNILLYVFLIVCIFCVIMTIVSKKDSDGAANLFGYQMRIVTSDSMAECELTDVSEYKIKSLPIRSLIFVQTVPDDAAQAEEWYRELSVGDVLTFRYVYTTQVTITHRITNIEEKATGGYIISLEGDNKNSESELMEQMIDTSETESTNYVIGKVVAKNTPLGQLISLMQKPIGIVLVVIVPCFIIILLEVIKIIDIVNADKRKKEKENKEKQNEEIEELKRKLAALEQMSQFAEMAKGGSETAEAKSEAIEKTESETKVLEGAVTETKESAEPFVAEREVLQETEEIGKSDQEEANQEE